MVMESRERHYLLDYVSAVAMRYHAHRRSFLEFASKGGTALSLLFGTAAFGVLVSGHPGLAKVATAAVAGVSALNLAFGTADAARKHGELFRKWADLRAELATTSPDDAAAVARLEVQRAKIDGESPGQLEALSVICENEEKEVRRSGDLYRVGFVQRALANLLTLPGWRPVLDKNGLRHGPPHGQPT